MANKDSSRKIGEYNKTNVGARIDGMPSWESRALVPEFSSASRKRPHYDMPFFVLTILLLAIGVVMVLSASFAREYYTSGEPTKMFIRQLVFAISGLALMQIVSRINIRTMSRWAMPLLVISIGLLVLVLLIGVKVNGSRRWLSFGGRNSALRFQPSEIAKLACVLSFAQMICKFGKERMRTFKYGVAPFIAIAGLIVVLLMMETHLSASIIITVLAALLMFAGGTRLRWFVVVGIVFVSLAVALFIMYVRAPAQNGEKMSVMEEISQVHWGDKLGYAGKRIDAWLNPDSDPLGDGFQIRQSLFAVGSGGLLGQGLGQSRQKYLYLPEEHNDYIFAVICEELGYIGAMLILMLFALMIIRGFWLALHAKDKFSSLVITGITTLLAIQVFLSVAVVTNLLPSTGISLPFFSYGGTALWLQLVEIGIVLSVSRDIPPAGTEDVQAVDA